MAQKYVRELVDHFDRGQEMSATPGMNGWAIKDTSSAGTPTYLCVAKEGLVMTLASTSEAEVVTLYQKDIFPCTLADLIGVEFVAKVSGIDAVTTLVMGVASAQNDTADSVTNLAWFRMEGSASTSAVVAESDDGSTDKDDIATGVTLSTTFKKFTIDFSQGLSNIRYFVDGERVAAATTFTLAGATSTNGVQPFVQIQKASGTGVPAVTLGECRFTYRLTR